MAAGADSPQLKTKALFLVALGVILIVVGALITGAMWQVYLGIAVVLLGATLTAYAMKPR